MRRYFWLCGILMGLLHQPVNAVDLFSEDFEGLTLLPIVTFESEIRSRNAWTDIPPAGWTVDNTNVSTFGNPNSGVTEFEGWRFVDKDWWILTAGDQRRSEFLNATGIVAVADPDEWDDFGNPRPEDLGFFDARLRTPPINLMGSDPNTVKAFFHSSWRDEEIQTATLTAHYDNGTSLEVLRWESAPTLPDDSPNPFFKDDAPNEAVTLDLMNPAGASSVELEFRVFDAENNWWWSFDNLDVFTGDGPASDGALRTIINRDTGNISITNNTGNAVDLRGFSVRSAAGAVNEMNATYLSDSDPNWLRATNFNDGAYDLSEVHLTSAMLNAGETIDFGDDVWINFHRDSSDFSFEYLIAGNDQPIPGIIEVTGNGGDPYQFLDLNYNGAVEITDWITFSEGFGSDLTGLPEAQRYNLGDLDNDGAHTHNDFIEFLRIYESINGAGSFEEDLASLPEPSSLGLTFVAGIGVLAIRRRRCRSLLAGVALTLFVVGIVQNDAMAQLTLFSEDFESVQLGSNVEEGDSQQEVWTDVPPAGWVIDNSGMPGDINNPTENGVREWYGWSFADKDWWTFVAGGQDRELFNRGSGVVMIADPDEWDDQDGNERTAIATASTPNDFYDTFIKTPSIAIPSGIPAGRIQLSFDSSWRDEAFDDLDGTNNQTATITASYDGGNPIEVLKWDSELGSDFFHDDNPNERVSIDLQYDGAATSLELEFGLGNAWNDWWWAVDNILVSVPAEPSILVIDPNDGDAELRGGDVIPVDIKSLDIQSATSQLTGNASGLSAANPNQVDGPDPGTVAGDSPGEQWEVLTNSSDRFFEAFLFGSTPFDSSNSIFLGNLFDESTPAMDRDITFSYSTATGDVIEGVVIYEPIDNPQLLCDFDADMDCDLADVNAMYPEFGSSNATFDLDGDGVVDNDDLTVWLSEASDADSLGREFLRGDADLDGDVDGPDFTTLAVNFGNPGEWDSGNFNVTAVAGGGTVDGPDFTSLALNFGHTSVSAVPEPGTFASFAILLMGAIVMIRRRSLSQAALVLLVAAILVPAATTQAFTLDRNYEFGDNPSEGASVGGLVPSTGFGTWDSAGELGMNQIINMLGKSVLNPALRPKYVSINDRPDGVSGLGVELNPLGVEGAYMHTGFTEALNFPERSPSSIFAPGGTIDYTVINDRGFQIWTKPTIVKPSHIVMDTNQHGVLIDANNNFAMRYAEVDYATDFQPIADEWYHLSVVRPFGPGSGSIFYINGVAEAAAFGQYNIERVVNEDTPSSNIDDLDNSPLVVGASTGAVFGQGEHYSGIVDGLEMFVMGFNAAMDFGEYEFADNNGYAAAFRPLVDGDLNGDNQVTLDDATMFADNWLREKRLTWTIDEASFSLVTGDLESRDWGDFNYDGEVNLGDWAILNNANPAAGQYAWELITTIPEPNAGIVLLLGCILVYNKTRRSLCE